VNMHQYACVPYVNTRYTTCLHTWCIESTQPARNMQLSSGHVHIIKASIASAGWLSRVRLAACSHAAFLQLESIGVCCQCAHPVGSAPRPCNSQNMCCARAAAVMGRCLDTPQPPTSAWQWVSYELSKTPQGRAAADPQQPQQQHQRQAAATVVPLQQRGLPVGSPGST
jgi:hypothetical protein